MDFNKFETTLKAHGMRITNSRRIIFELLCKAQKSLSAKEIFEKTNTNKKLKTDLASVYRNLDILTEVGLTHKFQDGRYKVCDHDESDEHHKHVHVLFNCTSCSKTEEISSHSDSICRLANELGSQTKLLGETHEIIVQGLCKSCS
jgi:Fur family ferric uptake transcriptional regulator